MSFWSERVRESRFMYSEEELRPYFPLPKVLEGLFRLAKRLFGVQIGAADGEVPVCRACGGLVKTATISFGQAMPEAAMLRALAAAMRRRT